MAPARTRPSRCPGLPPCPPGTTLQGPGTRLCLPLMTALAASLSAWHLLQLHPGHRQRLPLPPPAAGGPPDPGHPHVQDGGAGGGRRPGTAHSEAWRELAHRPQEEPHHARSRASCRPGPTVCRAPSRPRGPAVTLRASRDPAPREGQQVLPPSPSLGRTRLLFLQVSPQGDARVATWPPAGWHLPSWLLPTSAHSPAAPSWRPPGKPLARGSSRGDRPRAHCVVVKAVTRPLSRASAVPDVLAVTALDGRVPWAQGLECPPGCRRLSRHPARTVSSPRGRGASRVQVRQLLEVRRAGYGSGTPSSRLVSARWLSSSRQREVPAPHLGEPRRHHPGHACSLGPAKSPVNSFQPHIGLRGREGEGFGPVR